MSADRALQPEDVAPAEELNPYATGNALERFFKVVGYHQTLNCEHCAAPLWTVVVSKDGEVRDLDKWLRPHDKECPGMGFGPATTEPMAVLARRLRTVLGAVGDAGKCQSCARPVVWVLTKNDKRSPYQWDGLSHFAGCPFAQRHRKGGKR